MISADYTKYEFIIIVITFEDQCSRLERIDEVRGRQAIRGTKKCDRGFEWDGWKIKYHCAQLLNFMTPLAYLIIQMTIDIGGVKASRIVGFRLILGGERQSPTDGKSLMPALTPVSQ